MHMHTYTHTVEVGRVAMYHHVNKSWQDVVGVVSLQTTLVLQS